MTTLLMKGDDLMTPEKESWFREIIDRLKAGEPIQYILGDCYFHGNRFFVSPDVLIPRPETEELVDWILKEDAFHSLLDIGTGSGCIAISLKKERSSAEIYAMDISEKALSIAQKNALLNDAPIHFIHDSILSPRTSNQTYDIIVSNPPYILQKEKAAMHKNVLEHEPHLALFVDDEEPLLFYKKIAEYGIHHLTEQGLLFFEINALLGKETKEMLEEYGYHDVVIKTDINGKERMIRCRKK
jgi:release factor glutamine methyltransferase